MCRGCGDTHFENRERPALTDAMATLAEEIAQSDQEYALTYGALHIVIDDWNLEAEHIEWCLSFDGHRQPITEQERRIGEALLAMTEDERYVTLDRAEERSQELAHPRA